MTTLRNPRDLAPGEAQHSRYVSRIDRQPRVQYDYRADDGALFSVVCSTLGDCIRRRNKWLTIKDQPVTQTA